jgi:hypothetical protein
MFRTSIKIIGTVLAAAAVAVPVASAGSPRTPSVGQGFSLGVPLEYQEQTAPSSKPVINRLVDDYFRDANSVTAQTSAGIVDDWFRDGNRVVAVPQPTTPQVGQGFSLGVPLEYLAPVAAGPGATEYLKSLQRSETTTPRVGEGFSLGVPLEYQAQSVTTGSAGFDWSSAAIGAAIVAGVFLMIAGIGAMTIRARHGRGRVSAA